MSDTVSATAGWAPGDVGLTFVTPSNLATQASDLAFHVSGSNQNAPAAAPGLVVEFTTFTPDFHGLLPDVLPETVSASSSVYAVTVSGGPSSVILEFQTREPGSSS